MGMNRAVISPSRDLPLHLQRVLTASSGLHQGRYVGRFAPTPSGPLHLGNLRTALLSWLVARREGGVWLLRIDDLDTPRLRAGAVLSALDDLRWLGLDWDGPVVLQSQRRGLYNAVLSHLRRSGLLYACRCSRRQLGGAPIYPGTCRELDLAWGWQHNRLPAWRLRVRGQACASCGDVVVRRADGFIAYHLASAVDELAFGITEVVRGADLAPVRWAQEAVMEAMGQPPPTYRHVPLLCDAHGDKLAKREGSAGLRPLRDQGAMPADVVGSLAQGLHLVPAGIALTAEELLARVSSRPQALDACLQA